MKIATDKANEYDKTLRADDKRFDRTTVVNHEDGSHFLFMNAFACSYGFTHEKLGKQEYILVFTEHHGTHVYSSDDVTVFSISGENREHYAIDPLE